MKFESLFSNPFTPFHVCSRPSLSSLLHHLTLTLLYHTCQQALAPQHQGRLPPCATQAVTQDSWLGGMFCCHWLKNTHFEHKSPVFSCCIGLIYTSYVGGSVQNNISPFCPLLSFSIAWSKSLTSLQDDSCLVSLLP